MLLSILLVVCSFLTGVALFVCVLTGLAVASALAVAPVL